MSGYVGTRHRCLVCGSSQGSFPATESWRVKFRILFAVEGRWEEPHVVDVSDLDYDDDIHGYAISLPDSQDTVAVHVSVGCHSGPCTSDPSTACGFGYPIHDSCWEILNACRSSRAQDLTALIRRCLSIPPFDERRIYHCSGTYEINEEHPGRPGSDTVDFREDPRKIAYPPLNVVLPPIASRISPASRAPSDHDLFSMIPREIVQEILTWLPSPDVKNFRLASRGAATTTLSDFFWKSRYLGFPELAHLYEAQLSFSDGTMYGQWRSIYLRDRDLHTRQADAKHRLWTWTRCLNIWKLIDERGYCQGTSGCGLLDSSPEDYTTIQWTDACLGVQRDLHSGFDPRSICLYERVATISSTTRQVYVSLLSCHGSCYITGLRFVDCDGSSTAIGYVRKRFEMCIPLPAVGPSEMPLTGFLLTLNHYGIHGIAVETKEGSSGWVGDCMEPGTRQDFSTRRLTWERSGTATGQWLIKGGFDDSRLVSLSTSIGTERTELSRDYRPDEIQDQAMWVPQSIPYSVMQNWLNGPRLLRQSSELGVTRPGMLPPRGLGFQMGNSIFQRDYGLKKLPLLWINFDPATVAGVYVYASRSFSADDVWSIKGFLVDSNGSNQMGTCLSQARFQLEIDGPGGERITKITTVYKDLDAGEERILNDARESPKKLCGLIIYTNHGQVLAAPPVPNIEDLSAYDHSTLEHEAITGFCAPEYGSFLDFGIAY